MAQSEGLPLLQEHHPTDAAAQSPREKAQQRQNQARQTRRRVAVGLVLVTLVLATGLLIAKNHDAPWDDVLPPSLTTSASPYAQVVAKYRETADFDGVVQVRINGSVVFDEADGLADEEFEVSMAKDSIFAVGSNSKLFVAVALYQLQERGLVNLSEPVNGYLNEDDFANFGFPNQTTWCPRVVGALPGSPCESITFVQLMHMGSGFGDSLNCDNVDAAHCYRTAENLAYYKGSVAPYVGMFINDPLVFKPDTNYSYSNANYYLLSYMVEKISGERLDTYVKSMITDKIGLEDTYYDPYAGGLGIRRGVVQEYYRFYVQPSPDVKGELVATGTCSPYINSGAVSGSGGFRSTTSDMHHWYLDLFENRGTTSKVLNAESIRMILERVNPVNPTYGQGVGVVGKREDGWPEMLAYCGGVKCCMTCIAMLFPENSTDSSVVVSAFSNHYHAGFRDRESFEKYRPDEFLPTKEPDNLTYADGGGAIELRKGLLQAYQENGRK